MGFYNRQRKRQAKFFHIVNSNLTKILYFVL